jgi:hypothetical protein
MLLLFFAHYSDKLQMRYPFVLAGLLICLVGFAINTANVSIGVRYFGIFLCVGGSYSAFPGVIAWCVSSLACDICPFIADLGWEITWLDNTRGASEWHCISESGVLVGPLLQTFIGRKMLHGTSLDVECSDDS